MAVCAASQKESSMSALLDEADVEELAAERQAALG
jgi:hypothetical protein